MQEQNFEPFEVVEEDGRTILRLHGTEEQQVKVEADKVHLIMDAIAQGWDIDIEYADIEGDLDILDIAVIDKEPERTEDGKLFALINKGNIEMSYCNIRGYANFRGAHFSRPVYFVGTRFSEYANFAGVRFSGDTVFSSAQFSEVADFRSAQCSEKAFFVGAQFSGYADFRGAQFSGIAYFESAQFSKNAHFGSAQFSEYANFKSANFSGDTRFGSAQFSEYAYFKSANFSGIAYFESADFSEDANFRSAQFGGIANFESAQFSGPAYFKSANFSGDTGFGSAQFSGYANFESANFSGIANFESAQFSGDANFWSAEFHEGANFRFSAFTEEIDFGQTTFAGEADFSGVKFPKDLYLNLAKFGESSGLLLANSVYPNIYINFPDDPNKVRVFLDNPSEDTYLRLLKNQRDLGRPHKSLYVAMQRDRRAQKFPLVRWLEWFLFDFPTKYGTASFPPKGVLIYIASVLVVFTASYYGINAHLQRSQGIEILEYDKTDGGKVKSQRKLGRLDIFWFSLNTFIPAVKFVNVQHWKIRDDVVLKIIRCSTLATFESILGWLLIPILLRYFRL